MAYIDGSGRAEVFRLNADGSVDSSFQYALGRGERGNGVSLAVQPDGKLLVRGAFQIGTSPTTFCRLNADGSLDSSFDPISPPGAVSASTVRPDGKIFIMPVLTAAPLQGFVSAALIPPRRSS